MTTRSIESDDGNRPQELRQPDAVEGAESQSVAMYGTVNSSCWLTPSMVRVQLDGPGLTTFTATKFTDEYVVALFVPDGARYSPPFDVDEARSRRAEHRPRARRLTVRKWHAEKRALTLDIVAHGDDGYAGRWAQAAHFGDRLQLRGPNGGYLPNPDADWYLFAGDESAIPAIARSIEAVPSGRQCVVLLLVDDSSHQLELTSSADLKVMWLHRKSSEAPADLLADSIASLPWQRGVVDVFVHGEAREVRAVRKHLLSVRNIDRSTASISPYWLRSHDDDAWRRIRRQWLADQALDV